MSLFCDLVTGLKLTYSFHSHKVSKYFKLDRKRVIAKSAAPALPNQTKLLPNQTRVVLSLQPEKPSTGKPNFIRNFLSHFGLKLLYELLCPSPNLPNSFLILSIASSYDEFLWLIRLNIYLTFMCRLRILWLTRSFQVCECWINRSILMCEVSLFFFD